MNKKLKKTLTAIGVSVALIAGIGLTTAATNADYADDQVISYDGKWYTAYNAFTGKSWSFRDYSYGLTRVWVPAGHCLQLWEPLGVNTHTVCSTAGAWTGIRDVAYTWIKTTK